MKEYQKQYKEYLLDNVVPFWEKHCPDREYGGYFTCLDRDGSVYDTEKYMWMQWRIVWMFAELYNKVERRQAWLDEALQGFRFLTRYGKDPQGRYYFSLNREGVPAMAPYNAFSDCFAVMGAAAICRATGSEEARREALSAYECYSGRESRPKGEWTKELEGKKEYMSFGFYMMQLNLLSVLQEDLGLDNSRELARLRRFVLDTFYSPSHGVVFENMPREGGPDLSSMAGRHTNPGHALEAMWFIMSSARRAGEEETVRQAADIVLRELDYGLDREYGGIYYFLDYLKKPHVELQWDMKLWWVHCEALIASFLAYEYTGDRRFRDRFAELHEWTWKRFPDPEYGEWFGYLDRRGEVNNTLKGGKWKTFFHLPRMLQVIGCFGEEN